MREYSRNILTLVSPGKDIKFREREKLSEALGLTELTDAQAPLLSEILRLSKVGCLNNLFLLMTILKGFLVVLILNCGNK